MYVYTVYVYIHIIHKIHHIYICKYKSIYIYIYISLVYKSVINVVCRLVSGSKKVCRG